MATGPDPIHKPEGGADGEEDAEDEIGVAFQLGSFFSLMIRPPINHSVI